jgi:hypothetical protein
MNPHDQVLDEAQSLAHTQQFRKLSSQFHERQQFQLIIGAGCSMELKAPSFDDLRRKILTELTGGFTKTTPIVLPNVNLADFDPAWEAIGPSTRETILSNWIFPNPPYVGPYADLALLIKAGYFSTIISYNF